MVNKEKSFDAVKMMREIRDKISLDTKNMSFEDLKEFIKMQLSKNNTRLIG